MDIGAVQKSVQPLAVAAPVAPVEKPAEHREIIQAVKALNATEMFGQEKRAFTTTTQRHYAVSNWWMTENPSSMKGGVDEAIGTLMLPKPCQSGNQESGGAAREPLQHHVEQKAAVARPISD